MKFNSNIIILSKAPSNRRTQQETTKELICSISVNWHTSFCYFCSPDDPARAKWISALHAVEQLENTVLRPHTRKTLCSKVYTLSNIFLQQRARSGEQGSPILSTQHEDIPWAECSGLWGPRGSTGRHVSFSSGLARQQSFLFPFSPVCVPGPKPDGNKGKLLTEAHAKTLHLKRKRHLCTLPPPNPLFLGAVSQLTHSLVLVLISFH